MQKFVSINKKLLDKTLFVLSSFNKNAKGNKQQYSVG